MKKTKHLIVLFFLILWTNSLFAQIPDSVYYKRLYFTCKVWGQFKYQHSGIAGGYIDWDEVLLNHLDGIYTAQDNAAFNDSLLSMISDAGPIQSSFNQLPDIIDSLYTNNDIQWMNDSYLTNSVQIQLDSLISKYRPQYNYYLNDNINLNNNLFDNDTSYSNGTNFPDKNIQLLALFRYWNIIHFFYPFKNIMDQPWDETLKEFIPLILEVNNELDYHLTIRKLVTKINDTQGTVTSPILSEWDGNFHPPFLVRYIENKMVITQVLTGVNLISTGDIILEMDGLDVGILRDSLLQFASGSNEVSIEKSINNMILWGEIGSFEMLIFDGQEEVLVNLQRSDLNYSELTIVNTPIWKDTILENGCHYGIVDIGRLEPIDVDQMYADLKNTDAIIFDVRNLSTYSISGIIGNLFSSPINTVNFSIPDYTYSGRFSWADNEIGNWSSGSYSGKVIILFDERTQNHGEFNCMSLEKHSNAIKIGSTTSGTQGNVLEVYLPGNIIAYTIFTGTYYPDYTQIQRVGIIPDYFIEPTIQGIRNGEDEVMAFALNCNIQKIEQKEELEEVIYYYPNPVQNTLYLSSTISDAVHIEIVDLKGISVIQINHQYVTDEIDVSALPASVYFIKTIHEGLLNVQRFVKE
jgi:hypothetical protein